MTHMQNFSNYDSHKLTTEFNDELTSFTHTYVSNNDVDGPVRKEQWVRKDDDLLGIGGFGEVWKETCVQNGAVRAVKQVRRTRWQKIDNELYTLIEMSRYSENFVQFFGWFKNDDYMYLAMEYVGGGTLQDLIMDSVDGLSEANAKSITAQLLDGLKIMHAHDICHRDVKPQNILVVRWFPPTVKLGDFGISKRFADDTQLHTRVGTFAYMAPEILCVYDATMCLYTEAVDMWSLGCVVHQMITKNTPFWSRNHLFNYVDWLTPFPDENLKRVGSTATKFIKSLLMPLAQDRPTAEKARVDPWLVADENFTVWPTQTSYSAGDSELELSPGLGGYNSGLSIECPKEGLLSAVSSRDTDKVRLILDRNKNIMSKNYQLGHELLDIAVSKEYMDVATLILERGANKYFHVHGNDWKTSSLHLALDQGKMELFKFLLMNGVDVMSRDDKQDTLLHKAVISGETKVAKILVENGGEVNALSASGLTPLHLAAKMASLEMLRFLLDNGADPMYKTNDQITSLHIAAEAGHVDVVEFLLAHGVDIDVTTHDGITPLHYVLSNRGHIGRARLLLAKGASVNLKTDRGHTPLYLAALNDGDEALIRLLLQYGADASITTNSGRTPLHEAAINGNLELVKTFLEEGANIDAVESEGRTPLHLATNKGHIEVVQFLVTKGADIMARDADGATVLNIAASSGSVETVKYFHEKGEDINSPNGRGDTPLHQAAFQGNTEVIEYLLKNGADLMLRECTTERLPIHAAALRGHVDAFKLLLAAHTGPTDAILNLRDKVGYTSLHIAASAGQEEMVLFLLSVGADILSGAHHGESPLLAATRTGCTEMVKLLHSKGAEVDTPGYDKYRPLHYAADLGYTELASFLLRQGADIDARIEDGSTPLMKACASEHVVTVHMLVRWITKGV